MRARSLIAVVGFAASFAQIAEAQSMCGAWSLRSGVFAPSARYHHGMAFDAARGHTVLFGGELSGVGPGFELADTWVFNGQAWSQMTGLQSPSPRSATSMAYDPVRDRIVLFGGSADPAASGARQFYRDTWEWNGVAWQLVSTVGPDGRNGPAMAFDANRGRIVLAGGVRFDGCWHALSDVWEWNGATWTSSDPLPVATGATSLAFDSTLNRLVLFGGTIGNCPEGMFGLTLERAGTEWIVTNNDGPSPRAGHRMVYMPEAEGVVLFGGTTGNPDGEVGETWLRRQGAWQQLSITPTPDRRAFHGLVYDSTRNRAVLWGGAQNASQTNFGDHWEFSFADAVIISQPQSATVTPGGTATFQIQADGTNPQFQWRRNGVDLANSSRIEGATAASLQISSVNGADVGSYDCVVTSACGSVTSSTATLTIPTCDHAWTNQGAAAFGQRWVHAQAYSAVNAGTLLFGGRDAAGDTLSDTWLGTPNGWTRVATTGPSLRTDHAMSALDNGRVLLFGGKAVAGGAASVLGDTWEWNGTQWNLLSVTGPSPRLGHQMVLDTARDRVVLFGGIDAAGATVSDTWEWSGTGWTLVSANGPSARFAHAMAFDATNGETLVIGGYANSRLGDTWAWDGSAWRQASDSGFSPTYYATAAYDDTLGRVFMFGGWAAAGVNNGLLAWDGTAWTTVNLANVPSPRWTHAMSYDRATRSMVVTGGAASPGFSPIFADFSTLSIMPIAVGQPQDQTLIPGGTATFSVVSSRPNTTFQWKKNGVNLSNDARISGATGPTLVISNLQANDGGSYTCELATVCGSNVSGAAVLSCRPTFAQQPVGGTFEPGSVVTISTQVSTVGWTVYRWHRNGAPLFNGPVYAGASSPTLQFIGSDPSLAGTYSLLVTNSCGTRWSSDAVVLLSFPTCDSIDFNNDLSLFDPQDIDAFLSLYSEGPCIPSTANCNDIDFNNDGSVFDPCDIDTYLVVFSEGPCTLCGQ